MRRTLLLALLLALAWPATRRRGAPPGAAGLARRRRRRPAARARRSPATPSGTTWRAAAPSPCAPRSTGTRSSRPAPPTPTSRATDAVVLAGARSAASACCRCSTARPTGRRCTPATPRRRRATRPTTPGVLTLLVTRYGPSGSFWAEHPEVSRQPIRAWQIWNEPNLTRYWNVAPWAPSYVRLLKAADKALKAADPRLEDGPRRAAERELEGDRGDLRRGRARRVRRRHAAPVHRQARERDPDREDRPARDGAPPRPAAAGVGDRALVAGRPGQERRSTATSRRPRPARRAGSPPGCRCSPSSGATLRIERVYWYTWLSAEGFTGSAFDYSGLRRLRDGAVARRAGARDVPAPGPPPAGLREARRATRAAAPEPRTLRAACATTGATARSWPSGRSAACCSPRCPGASRSRCCRSGSCCTRPPRPARRRPRARSSRRSRPRARWRRRAGGSWTATARVRWRPSRWPAPPAIARAGGARRASSAPRAVLVLLAGLAGLFAPPLGPFTRVRLGTRAARARAAPAAHLRARLGRRGGGADRRAARSSRSVIALASPRARAGGGGGGTAGRARSPPAAAGSRRTSRPPRRRRRPRAPAAGRAVAGVRLARADGGGARRDRRGGAGGGPRAGQPRRPRACCSAAMAVGTVAGSLLAGPAGVALGARRARDRAAAADGARARADGGGGGGRGSAARRGAGASRRGARRAVHDAIPARRSAGTRRDRVLAPLRGWSPRTTGGSRRRCGRGSAERGRWTGVRTVVRSGLRAGGVVPATAAAVMSAREPERRPGYAGALSTFRQTAYRTTSGEPRTREGSMSHVKC